MIPQTQADLEKHLAEQIQFLESSTASFDSGFESESKRLATTLRVLLHDTTKSHSLLEQLKKKATLKFYDTAHPVDPDNLLTHSGLVSSVFKRNFSEAKWVPLLDDGLHGPVRQVDFDTWWTATVFVDKDRQMLSRKDLVLTMANMDGGAHVDPRLDETYARLSRQNSLNVVYGDLSNPQPMSGPERAAIRQIAHEVLKTLIPGYTKTAIDSLPKDSIAVGAMSMVASKPQVPEMHGKDRNNPCPCGSGKKYKFCHGKSK